MYRKALKFCLNKTFNWVYKGHASSIKMRILKFTIFYSDENLFKT